MAEDKLDLYRRINTRRASVLKIGGFRPTRNPLTSHFGLAPAALPGEGWPHVGDRPMLFVCQLNLAEPPFVPDVLRGIALITVFLDAEASAGRENGDGWLLRSYESLDELAPLTAPEFPKRPRSQPAPRGFEVRYDVVDDHPVYDDPDIVLPPGWDDRPEGHLPNVRRTKIGGYASNIQSSQWWNDHLVYPTEEHAGHPSRPRFAFQIGTEEKVGLYLGDDGILYFARGTAPGHEGEWFADAQCY